MTALLNKTAIVTGASSGIGYSTAILFAMEGANVVVGARRKPELDALVDEIIQLGGHAISVTGDVKDEHYAKELVAIAKGQFGGLDVAFNNAGTIGSMKATIDEPLEEWSNTIETNLTSAFLGAKYQIPAMLDRNGGSIIFTSTFVGYTVGLPNMAAYSASKAGLIGLAKALAAEYSPKGIRINALLPGGTDTPMGRTFANTPETIDFVNNLHAMKRMALPEEIAQSALYLASTASSFTTGSALLADGGVSINRT